jgi:hypothetical protein
LAQRENELARAKVNLQRIEAEYNAQTAARDGITNQQSEEYQMALSKTVHLLKRVKNQNKKIQELEISLDKLKNQVR